MMAKVPDKIKIKQTKRKKSPEDLQAHLNERRRGASITDDKSKYHRHDKHKGKIKGKYIGY